MKVLSRVAIAFAATTVLGFALACSGGESGPKEIKSSCNEISDISECADNDEDAYFMGEDFLKSLCSGDFQQTPCPTEDVVGSCDDELGTFTRYYSTGESAYTSSSAESDCGAMDGKWIAIP